VGTVSIQFRRQSWDTTRIKQAKILAKRSLCTRDQVGAIIVDKNDKVIGEGYNGPPAGFPRPFSAPPGWINPDPSQHESPCTNWCPRAQQRDKSEEYLWSADFKHPAHRNGSLMYENGQHWWLHGNNDANRTLLDTDEKMERYGFVKVKKPGISLSVTYDDCPSLHAEANALITSDRSLRVGGTIYVTSDVCMGCAKLIANSGLTKVYVAAKRYDKHRNPQASYDFLLSCGVDIKIDRPVTRDNDRTV
jgi:deoxycytidylate deaminase